MPFSSLPTDGAVLTEVGARLTAARSALGLSTDALAVRCGLDFATVERAEAGEPIWLADFICLLRALDLLDALEGLFTASVGPAGAPARTEQGPSGGHATPPALPEPTTGFVMRDNRSRHRAPARRARGPLDRRSSGGPKPPGRFIWGDDPPPTDA